MCTFVSAGERCQCYVRRKDDGSASRDPRWSEPSGAETQR